MRIRKFTHRSPFGFRTPLQKAFAKLNYFLQ